MLNSRHSDTNIVRLGLVRKEEGRQAEVEIRAVATTRRRENGAVHVAAKRAHSRTPQAVRQRRERKNYHKRCHTTNNTLGKKTPAPHVTSLFNAASCVSPQPQQAPRCHKPANVTAFQLFRCLSPRRATTVKCARTLRMSSTPAVVRRWHLFNAHKRTACLSSKTALRAQNAKTPCQRPPCHAKSHRTCAEAFKEAQEDKEYGSENSGYDLWCRSRSG